MNNLKNNVRLIGHLGQNPDVKNLNSGKKLTRLSLAVNESYKNEQGERINETQWHNITVWGKQAELAEKLLRKGSEVAIEGKLSNNSYVDKDGVKRYTTEIVLSEFLLLGGKKQD